MIAPPIPHDKLVIIAVRLGRYQVARYVETAPYRFEVQRADNWEALEPQALQAIEDVVGAATSDDYPCPPELAVQAVWAK